MISIYANNTMNQYPFYPGRGNISIDSNPPGATIYVDGYALQDENGNIITTPAMVIGAMDGIHEIQISLDRYYSKKIFVDVIPGNINRAFTELIPMS
jgi:hypothetical protein